jgi:DNA segregation ATPase FtsK/SpoIIIE-like protein
MRTNGLRPRAIGALSVVAASLFLLLCLANYGQGGFETAGEAPWHLGLAGWFVEVFGAGAFALVLLPLVWGLVVYFREDTPSLSMRAAGTLLLACSISMVSGLVQGAPEMSWAGAVGEYTVALTHGLGGVIGNGLALALGWAAAVTLFMASLVWATDWWFHSLRKGVVVPVLPSRPRIETEPTNVELLVDDAEDEAEEREFVAMPTAGRDAISGLHTAPAEVELPAVEEIPDGFSSRESGDRVVVAGPVGYQGVEFLPPSDELAPSDEPEERLLNDEELVLHDVIDDEFEMEPEEDRDAIQPAAETEALFGEDDAGRIATVEETIGTMLTADDPIVLDDASASLAAEAVVEDLLVETASESDEAIVEPSTEEPIAEQPVAEDGVVERPRSGIGLPEDSPFVDEYFAVDVIVEDDVYEIVDDTPIAGEGASAESEIEEVYGTPIPAPAPEPEIAPEIAPGPPAAVDAEPAERAAPVVVDDLLFADAYDVPAPIAERATTPESPEPPSMSTTAQLDRIRDMQLDPLFHDAVDVVLEAGRGSAMSFQRRFGIGHGRGLRLLEQLEEAGILAAEDASGTRELLIERAEWEAFSGSEAS